MAGTVALGSKLFSSVDSGTTYVEVAQVTQVSRPKPSKGDIDVTTLTSTAKENLKDVPDYGTASYAFNFDGGVASHVSLIGWEVAGTEIDWLVELTETGAATKTHVKFVASVESVGVDASVGGKQDGTLDLRVNGAVTTTFAQIAT